MLLVITAALLIACFCLVQTIYTIRTGVGLPFFTSSGSPRLGAASKGLYATIYFVPFVGIVSILAYAALQGGLNRAWFLIKGNVGLIIWMAIFAIVGLLHLFWPATMLSSLKRSNPYIPVDRKTILISRLVGASFVVFVLIMLSKLG